MKKFILAFCLCISVLGGGCMNPAERMINQEKEALKYLNEKYGREFEARTYEVADYLSGTNRIHCYTEGMDIENEHIEVYVAEKEGENVYRDNYFSYHVRPQAEEYIRDMVESEFTEVKVFRNNEYEAFPDELTGESTLDDLYRVKEDYWMDLKVYVNGDPAMAAYEYEEKMQRIEQKLLESNHRYTIYIFVVNEEIYQSMERYKQEDFFRFFAQNRTPDGEKFYYAYKSTIMNGKVM